MGPNSLMVVYVDPLGTISNCKQCGMGINLLKPYCRLVLRQLGGPFHKKAFDAYRTEHGKFPLLLKSAVLQ